MKNILLLSLILVVSCAFNNRSRKNVALSEVVLKGGVYKDISWDEKIIFKRTSWYHEATMQYDILIKELKTDSKFVNWLGRDKEYLKECSTFYVAAIYSDINIGEGTAFLESQFNKLGLERKSIMDFNENFRAHHNFSDWRLFEYKVIGLCESKNPVGDIIVSIPGYKTQKL